MQDRIATAVAGIPTPLFSRTPTPAVPNFHLPEGEMRTAPDGGLRSRAVHSVEGARAAADEGVDLVVFGHVFDTPSKAGVPGRGIGMLRDVCAAAAPLPVFALGGITVARVPDVRAAGAFGVGVMRELLAAGDGKAATEAFLRALRSPG